MKKESEAHEALSLLFHRDGVPNIMFMDGVKGQTEGKLRRKMRDTGCEIKKTEPHTQYSNIYEGGVRELKRGVGRQMLRSGSPKQLWDDYIIRELHVRSHTSLDIFGLEGQVPESKVKGETVDISTIEEYAWYEWVKFRDTAAKFSVSKIQLGRDLGAAIDIVPAMARNILKKNGSVMYRTSVRSLTPDEIQSPTEKKESEEFVIATEKKFCASMDKIHFKDDPDYADFVTPTYD
jgi:intein/homing endonuclease